VTVKAPRRLYLQVITAIILGIVLGHYFPDLGVRLKPLGDVFIGMIKLLVAPIIFVTVVVGIAKAGGGSGSSVGRLGLKAFIYFEVVTTLAMILGLCVGHLINPAEGMNVNLSSLDASGVSAYKAAAKPFSVEAFLIHIVPTSMVEPFVKGDMLQILFLSILTGIALSKTGETGARIASALDKVAIQFFAMVALVMKFAPIGAFGAMAFTIGKFGVSSLSNLGTLLLCFYVTCFLFVAIVLNTIVYWSGFSLVSLARYFKDEALIVFATASNEAVLPALVGKLQRLGCKKEVVGLALPMSYAMNLDGACIYYTLALTFMAQAIGVDLTWGDQLTFLAILLLTSKGSATVTGGGFITMAATLATVGGKVPVDAMILLVGIDRFMSEARSFTNFCGNVIATIAISRLENALDMEQAKAVLNPHADRVIIQQPA
jgi:aerobic C4-dicarboxylate transport protein